VTVIDALAFWTVASIGLGLTIGPILRIVTGEPEQPILHNRRAGDR